MSLRDAGIVSIGGFCHAWLVLKANTCRYLSNVHIFSNNNDSEHVSRVQQVELNLPTHPVVGNEMRGVNSADVHAVYGQDERESIIQETETR